MDQNQNSQAGQQDDTEVITCFECGKESGVPALFGFCRRCFHASRERSFEAEMRLPGGLRDQFAMAAPIAPFTRIYGDHVAANSQFVKVAGLCYEWADAMLEARKKP